VKQNLKPFEIIQIDIKGLNDIPQYLPYIIKGFSKYQFSARDVRTCISFISYGYEKSSTNVGIFSFYLVSHLKNLNIDLTRVQSQSDNGTEFIGSPKTTTAITPYIKIVNEFHI